MLIGLLGYYSIFHHQRGTTSSHTAMLALEAVKYFKGAQWSMKSKKEMLKLWEEFR